MKDFQSEFEAPPATFNYPFNSWGFEEELFGGNAYIPQQVPGNAGTPKFTLDWSAINADTAPEKAVSDSDFLSQNVRRLELPDVDTLDSAAKQKIEDDAAHAAPQLVAAMSDRYLHVSRYDLVDPIFRAWFVSRQMDSGAETNWDSFESFANTYIPNNDEHIRGTIMREVGSFVFHVVNKRELMVYRYSDATKSREYGRYNLNGEWLKTYGDGNYRTFVDATLVDEIDELGDAWPEAGSMVYHESGSAALGAIGAESALLSASEVIRRGHTPQTGEFIEIPQFSTGWGDKTLEERASGQVWGAESMSGSYSTCRWFDEYPVAFGIAKDKLIEYRRQKGMDNPYFRDTSEGLLLGSEVPLDFINAMYVPQVNMAEAREWQNANCPHSAILISLEAAKNYGRVADNRSNFREAERIRIS